VEVYETQISEYMRKDLTISLDESHINELLEIAETQNITLSGLIRTIITSYVQAIHEGTAPALQNLQAYGEEETDVVTGSPVLAQTVARHGTIIAELERRVAQLESGVKRPGIQTVPGASVSDLMALTCPVPHHQEISEVIDSDLPPVLGLSDEALVKVPRQPVAPVMDAMEMGSMKVHLDKEYSQTEAAVALGVSVSTIRKYIKDKRIPARKVGRSWLIHGKDILSFQSIV
jgi:excisionase family DNA binding protein